MDKVELYCSNFPETTKEILIKIRQLIKSSAPNILESISYGMPAYKTNGKPLIYFAGYKNHIGIYATPSGHKQFSEELSEYKQGKGSVQFPLNKPIPYQLIQKIIIYKLNENS